MLAQDLLYFCFKLATTLCPQEVRAGTAVAMVNGTLQNKNNKYTLSPLERY